MYKQLSLGLRDVLGDSMKISTMDSQLIADKTRKVLCYFRIVLSKSCKKSKSVLRKLSNIACEKMTMVPTTKLTTYTMVRQYLGKIKTQQNIVLDIHETLHRLRLIPKLLKCTGQYRAKHRIRGCKRARNQRKQRRLKKTKRRLRTRKQRKQRPKLHN